VDTTACLGAVKTEKIENSSSLPHPLVSVTDSYGIYLVVLRTELQLEVAITQKQLQTQSSIQNLYLVYNTQHVSTKNGYHEVLHIYKNIRKEWSTALQTKRKFTINFSFV
jgi:hypothetical protein